MKTSLDDVLQALEEAGVARCTSLGEVAGERLRCVRALDHRGQHEDVTGDKTWWFSAGEWRGRHGDGPAV